VTFATMILFLLLLVLCAVIATKEGDQHRNKNNRIKTKEAERKQAEKAALKAKAQAKEQAKLLKQQTTTTTTTTAATTTTTTTTAPATTRTAASSRPASTSGRPTTTSTVAAATTAVRTKAPKPTPAPIVYAPVDENRPVAESKDPTWNIEHYASAAERNDPTIVERKIEVLIDVETWRAKFNAERAKRMKVLASLESHPLLNAAPATPDPDQSKGPLERECHLILREETARLERGDFENFRVGGGWDVGGLLPVTTTKAPKTKTPRPTPAPPTPFPHFPYQAGQWFEGNWLYEDVVGAPLRAIDRLHSERIEQCLKSRWLMVIGDTNAMNMFRALQGRISGDPVSKTDDTGLFGDLDYLYEVAGGEQTLLMSFRYVGSHLHAQKARQVIEHPHDTLRWLNDAAAGSSDWDYANPLRLMPRPVPHSFAAMTRPDVVAIGIGGWAAASGVESDPTWRSGEQELAAQLVKWLAGVQLIWKSVSPVAGDAERNRLVAAINENYYATLRANFSMQVRIMHVEPFFADDATNRLLKSSDRVTDSRRAADLFADLLLDMLCVNLRRR
jgi:hypothetical protein